MNDLPIDVYDSSEQTVPIMTEWLLFFFD